MTARRASFDISRCTAGLGSSVRVSEIDSERQHTVLYSFFSSMTIFFAPKPFLFASNPLSIFLKPFLIIHGGGMHIGCSCFNATSTKLS